MYDELVKSLRDMSKMGTKYGMAVVKMREAADAIEEMQKCLDGVEADNDSLCETIAELFIAMAAEEGE